VPREAAQEVLPFNASQDLTCAQGLEEPAMWVRRVVIWHDVSAKPIRDVELRRGLNIVWSPTGSEPDAFATGHAAGKTLLCRLIRHCLGEESFADPEDTDAIRGRFPGGAVAAEIRLRGTTWVVRRSFGLPRDDRAQEAETVESVSEEIARGSYTGFLSAVEASALAEAQRLPLTEADPASAWQYVLAWLTRDQECRIDGLTHWRHPESSSHSPVRRAGFEARLGVLRVALGLFSDAAFAARTEAVAASARKDATEVAARRATARFDALRDELASALNVDPNLVWPPPPPALFQDEQSTRDGHLRSLLTAADQKIRATMALTADPGQLQEDRELEGLAGTQARLSQQVATLRGEIEREGERAKLLEAESASRWAEAREAKHPTCPYDGTPLDVAAALFVCPLPRLPDPAAAATVAAENEAARKEALAALAELEVRLASMLGEKASLDAKVETLRRRFEDRQRAMAEATAASQSAWATKAMVRRLFELRADADEAIHSDDEAKRRLDEVLREQVQGLTAFSTSKLERWFDFLIRRVVAPEAKGTITLDGNGLHPKIHWRGTRRSVALNSLQIVLFDVAAMLCAVEGDSRAPAFLVHDSPREGDLDPRTYARIFEALFELGPDADTAPFQYIVTTTTDPPAGRVRARVRLELGADKEEHRLFKVDL
jgi:hypothetical protein